MERNVEGQKMYKSHAERQRRVESGEGKALGREYEGPTGYQKCLAILLRLHCV